MEPGRTPGEPETPGGSPQTAHSAEPRQGRQVPAGGQTPRVHPGARRQDEAFTQTERLPNPFPPAAEGEPWNEPFVERPRPAAAPPARSGSRGWPTVVASALVAAIVSAVTTFGITQSQRDDQPAPAAAEQQAAEPQAAAEAGASTTDVLPGGTSVADVAEAVLPSVARVDVTGTGSGSAVVYSENGYLVTNNHVVEGARDVTVTLPDTQVVRAEVVGTDRASDLAVLKLDRTGLTPPPFAEQQPRPGETAIAIGSPFGLDSTVTSGIVSATERDVSAPGAGILVGMLQTDAAINPGNSGGALVNDRGELIGINTAILSRTGQSGGIGFAIPVSTVRTVADQLIEQGFVEYAYLGVSTQDLNPGVAAQLGLDSTDGALVAEVVVGSAADRAGLQRGDVIVALNEQPITSSGDLVAAVRSYSPGDEASVTFIRDGRQQLIELAFGTLPSQD